MSFRLFRNASGNTGFLAGGDQLKSVLGFRQFLLRGREKVSLEWLLVCVSYNFMRFFAQKPSADRIKVKARVCRAAKTQNCAITPRTKTFFSIANRDNPPFAR
jgi:hypothetical protein